MDSIQQIEKLENEISKAFDDLDFLRREVDYSFNKTPHADEIEQYTPHPGDMDWVIGRHEEFDKKLLNLQDKLGEIHAMNTDMILVLKKMKNDEVSEFDLSRGEE